MKGRRQSAMKKHLPLMIVLFTVAVTIALLLDFIPRIRRIMTAQANPTIHLPVAPTLPGSSDSEVLNLRLTVAGASYGDEMGMSDTRLAELITARLNQRVVVEIAPGINYE